MNDNDKEDFHKLMNLTYEMYGRPEPSKNIVRMYYGALIRYPFDDIKSAVNRHAVDPDAGQYVPKPADIVRNIDGNTQTRSELAWTKVDLAIRSIGSHESVCFDDPIIHSVIEDMGGWITLNKVENDEYPFKHNEFIKRYRGYAMRPPTRALRRLIGSNEAGNVKDGYLDKIPAPVLIGDRQMALGVLESGREEERKIIHRLGDLLGNAVKKLTDGSNG